MYFSMKRSNASFLTNKLDIFCSYQTHFLTKIAKIAMLSAARQRHLGRHATLLSVIRFVKESCAATQMTDAWATSMKQLAITRMLRGIGSVLLDSNII